MPGWSGLTVVGAHGLKSGSSKLGPWHRRLVVGHLATFTCRPAVDASSIDLAVVPAAAQVGGIRRLAPDRAAPTGGDEPVAGGQDGDDEQRGSPQRVAGRKEDDPDHYSDQRDQPTEHGELARRTTRHGDTVRADGATARRDTSPVTRLTLTVGRRA